MPLKQTRSLIKFKIYHEVKMKPRKRFCPQWQQVFHKIALSDEVIFSMVVKDFPLWEGAPLNQNFESNHKECLQYYKKIKTGEVCTRVQIYYHETQQVHFKDFFAWYDGEILVGERCGQVYEYYDFLQLVESKKCNFTLLRNTTSKENNVDNLTGLNIRGVPQNILHLKSPYEIFIPPTTSWSEYFYEGEEIELQWGSGFFWWRGIVEKIDGAYLQMIYTQWEDESIYYREIAVFGQQNGQCYGVRKLNPNEKLFYRKMMIEAGHNLWPRDWNKETIELFSQKNLK